MPTAREVVRSIAGRLAAGLGSPSRVEAELLAAHVLDTTRSALILHPELTAAELAELDALVARRLSGVPLQHLLGTAPYRHLVVAVGPGVFIPRPETELLLDLAEPALQTARSVVDLCSGSGAVALAVAGEYPSCRVWAVERSEAALVWLTANVARLDPGRRVQVVSSDVADPTLLVALTGTVDVVLANPPYVPRVVAASLAPEIAFDPDEAVFAADNGLAVIRPVAIAAARLLRPGGLFVVEHDESHQPELLDWMHAAGGWSHVTPHADLNRHPRFVSAVRSE
jgi:release factor glutamine methyltransferase